MKTSTRSTLSLISLAFLAGLAMASASSSCCSKLKIQFGNGFGRVGAAKAHPKVYADKTKFELKSGKVNGKEHWVSENDKYAIWYSGKSWLVGSVANQGTTRSYFSNTDDSSCPHNFDYGWRYYYSKLGDWLDAEEGFNINCD